MNGEREGWRCPVCNSLARDFQEAFDRYVEVAADLYHLSSRGLGPVAAQISKEVRARQKAEDCQRAFYRHQQVSHAGG